MTAGACKHVKTCPTRGAHEVLSIVCVCVCVCVPKSLKVTMRALFLFPAYFIFKL